MLALRLPHLALMMAVNLAWGLNFIAVKYAVDELPPVFATGLRFLLIFLLLLPVLRPVPGKMKDLLLAAITIGAVHFSVLYYAISIADNMSSVAIATLTNVPFATILAVIFLRERIGIYSISGLILAFTGVMVLGFDPRAFDQMTSLLLVMLAAFIYAVGAILLRRLSGVGVFNLQAWIGVSGAIAVLGLSFLVESGQWPALQVASWYAIGGVIFSSVFSSIIGHGGLYYLLKRYPVSTITPLTLLSQVFAVIASILILGDVLTWRILLGGLLTFAGASIIVYRKKQKAFGALPADPEKRT
ncbi:MAG TPA: DMT family transporter [Sphingomonadales bacterium]|nr:DMT family transporter [Sphingomonadales bacterium]